MICLHFHPTPNPAKIARAREAGKDHPFKRVNDEETMRALFPSDYPSAA